MGLWNVTYLGPSTKLIYFESQIAAFVGIWDELLLFETQTATFAGISKKLCIYYFFTESAAFPGESTNLILLSINYVKLKLNNQLLQGQFIVADVLMELDYLNLMRIFNFLDIYMLETLQC